MMGDIDTVDPSLVRYTADEPLEIDLLPQDEVTTAAAQVRSQSPRHPLSVACRSKPALCAAQPFFSTATTARCLLSHHVCP